MPSILPRSVATNAEKLKQYFTYYPDFPKKGIQFWDIFALYSNPEALPLLNVVLAGYAELMKDEIDVVVGIEARGFLLGPTLANLLNCTFVPARKKGKLPGSTRQKTYALEYGTDTIEIQECCLKTGQRAVVVDDCIATGGMAMDNSTEIRFIDYFFDALYCNEAKQSILLLLQCIIMDQIVLVTCTLNATCDLIEEIGAKVVDCMVIYEIPELKGSEKVSYPITKLCS